MSGFQELVVEGFGEEITEDSDDWDDANREELERLQQKEDSKYKESTTKKLAMNFYYKERISTESIHLCNLITQKGQLSFQNKENWLWKSESF